VVSNSLDGAGGGGGAAGNGWNNMLPRSGCESGEADVSRKSVRHIGAVAAIETAEQLLFHPTGPGTAEQIGAVCLSAFDKIPYLRVRSTREDVAPGALIFKRELIPIQTATEMMRSWPSSE